MVECLDGIQEVRGSTPLGSTGSLGSTHARKVGGIGQLIEGRSFDGVDVVRTLGDDERPPTFVSCSFVGAALDDADLIEARFEDCDLTGAGFIDSDLTRSTFERCRGERPNFTGCDLTDASFTRCELVNALFVNVEATDASWNECKLLGSTFQHVHGMGWTIENTTMMYANLAGVGFAGRTLVGLDLTEADVKGSDFSRCVFEDCRLSRAIWTNAVFDGADLRGADLGPISDLPQIAALKGAVLSERQAKAIVNALGISVIPSDEA